MTSFTKLLAAATLAVGSFAIPALAQDNAQLVTVDLWDAGSNMEMTTGNKINDDATTSTDSMGVMISHQTVPAGEITFNVINSSTDIEHEMVVGNLAVVEDPATYDESIARVNEDVDGANIGEVPELEPGAAGTLTLNLKPGQYALYCNIAGHYASGMWTILTVK